MMPLSRRSLLRGIGALSTGALLKPFTMFSQQTTCNATPIIAPPPGAVVLLFEGPWLLSRKPDGGMLAVAPDNWFHKHIYEYWARGEKNSGPQYKLQASHRYTGAFSPNRQSPPDFDLVFQQAFCESPFTYLQSTQLTPNVAKSAITIDLSMPDQVKVAATVHNVATIKDVGIAYGGQSKQPNPVSLALIYNNVATFSLTGVPDGGMIRDPFRYFTIHLTNPFCQGKKCSRHHVIGAFDDLRRVVVRQGANLPIEASLEPGNADEPEIINSFGLSHAQLGVPSGSRKMLGTHLASCAGGPLVLGRGPHS